MSSPLNDWMSELASHLAQRNREELEAWLLHQGEHVLRSPNPTLWMEESRWYYRRRDAERPAVPMVSYGSLPAERPWRWTKWRSRPRPTLPKRVAADPVKALLAPDCPEWVLAVVAKDASLHQYPRMVAVAKTQDPALIEAVVLSVTAQTEREDVSLKGASIVTAAVENPACPAGSAQRALATFGEHDHVLAAVAGNANLPDEVRVMAALLAQDD